MSTDEKKKQISRYLPGYAVVDVIEYEIRMHTHRTHARASQNEEGTKNILYV